MSIKYIEAIDELEYLTGQNIEHEVYELIGDVETNDTFIIGMLVGLLLDSTRIVMIRGNKFIVYGSKITKEDILATLEYRYECTFKEIK
jgi:hypothetical protein